MIPINSKLIRLVQLVLRTAIRPATADVTIWSGSDDENADSIQISVWPTATQESLPLVRVGAVVDRVAQMGEERGENENFIESLMAYPDRVCIISTIRAIPIAFHFYYSPAVGTPNPTEGVVWMEFGGKKLSVKDGFQPLSGGTKYQKPDSVAMTQLRNRCREDRESAVRHVWHLLVQCGADVSIDAVRALSNRQLASCWHYLPYEYSRRVFNVQHQFQAPQVIQAFLADTA